MKKFSKNLIVFVLAIALVLGFTGANTAYAELASGFLGLTSTYAVFGDAGIIGGAASHVWGDAGQNGFSDGSIEGHQDGTYYAAAQPTVVSAISSAYGALASETQTGTINLAVPNTIGPGVYDVGSTATFTAAQTLSGAGTYIFRGADSIAQTAGGTMTLTGGACASNVYWRTGTQMTFAATGNIEGTIIAGSAITFANSALTFKGRALAGTNVDLGGITITEPATCAAPTATLNVVKVVVNNNGRSNVVSDFPLFVNGSPATSGVITTGLVAGTYTVTETYNASNYTQTFSASCPGGIITLAAGGTGLCTITNDDIAASSGGSSGGGVVYGCKDITATNYNFFSSSRPELCTYAIVAPVVVATPVVTPTVIVPKLPKTGFPPQEPWYMVILSDFLNLIK